MGKAFKNSQMETLTKEPMRWANLKDTESIIGRWEAISRGLLLMGSDREKESGREGRETQTNMKDNIN